jgi:hypothetical protein
MSAGEAADQLPSPASPPIPERTPAEKGETKGWLDSTNFRLLNEMAEEGSRLAGHIRNAKAALWALIVAPPAASGVATQVNTVVGTGQLVVAHHSSLLPILLTVALTVSAVALIAYLFVKFRIEPHFVSAIKDGRYSPRAGGGGAPLPQPVEQGA